MPIGGGMIQENYKQASAVVLNATSGGVEHLICRTIEELKSHKGTVS
jgi:hypothetical protein